MAIYQQYYVAPLPKGYEVPKSASLAQALEKAAKALGFSSVSELKKYNPDIESRLEPIWRTGLGTRADIQATQGSPFEVMYKSDIQANSMEMIEQLAKQGGYTLIGGGQILGAAAGDAAYKSFPAGTKLIHKDGTSTTIAKEGDTYDSSKWSIATSSPTPTPTSTPTATPPVSPTAPAESKVSAVSVAPEQPKTLTPQQIEQYYASEGKKANPLSPLDWLAQQGGGAATAAPVATAPVSTAPATTTTYKIVSGDTLSGISAKYGTTVDALMKANPSITDPNLIYAGASLNIPGATAPSGGGAQQPTGGGGGATPTGTPDTTTAPPPATPTTTISTDVLSGNQTPVTIPEQPQQDYSSALESLFEKYMGKQETPPSGADEYAGYLGKTPQEIAREQQAAQKEYNDLSAQLRNITAGSQVANQQLESAASGKDITTTFLGRQQQEVNRQAAIKGLPIAAQLAVAQDNLGLAQQHLDKLFSLQLQDVQNQYNYKQGLIDKVYQFATSQEQAKLNAKKEADTRTYNDKVNNLNQAQSWATAAIENGQGDLASQIMALDPNDKDYQAKLGQLAGQIKAQDELLSEAEAKSLGVPYGTTKAQAVVMGKVPGGDKEEVGATTTAVRNWILENKRANPDIPYYDLWGVLAEDMASQGLNPSNYDKLFWEILHPEGLAGYDKYVKASGSSGLTNEDLAGE